MMWPSFFGFLRVTYFQISTWFKHFNLTSPKAQKQKVQCEVQDASHVATFLFTTSDRTFLGAGCAKQHWSSLEGATLSWDLLDRMEIVTKVAETWNISTSHRKSQKSIEILWIFHVFHILLKPLGYDSHDIFCSVQSCAVPLRPWLLAIACALRDQALPERRLRRFDDDFF